MAQHGENPRRHCGKPQRRTARRVAIRHKIEIAELFGRAAFTNAMKNAIRDGISDGKFRLQEIDKKPQAARGHLRTAKHRLWQVSLGVAFGIAAAFALSILLVLPWRWFAPPTTSFMEQMRLQSQSRAIAYEWVAYEKISPWLAISVVAAEDQKFPTHYGFDIDSITDAMKENSKRPRGASTISQQVAKNLFLWPGRSFVRKGMEAYFTVLIETLWPKRRILEVYLNIAQFGPQVFGAEAASRQFFGKPARQLTAREAALLTSVLPNPKRMHVSRPSRYVRRRAAEIEHAVRQLGGPAYLADL